MHTNAMMLTSILSFSLLGSACGPVTASAPVGINLEVKAEDGRATLDEGKGITTENGNPYGAFISNAKKVLGRDPSRVEVDSVTLFLGGKSSGVTGLEQVFGGRADVLFLMNDTNNSYPAAHLDAPSGAGPVAMGVDWNGGAVTGADYTRLLGGSFKVVIRGPAAAGFQKKGPVADLQATFTFTAFE